MDSLFPWFMTVFLSHCLVTGFLWWFRCRGTVSGCGTVLKSQDHPTRPNLSWLWLFLGNQASPLIGEICDLTKSKTHCQRHGYTTRIRFCKNVKNHCKKFLQRRECFAEVPSRRARSECSHRPSRPSTRRPGPPFRPWGTRKCT